MAPEDAVDSLNGDILEKFVAENYTTPRIVLSAYGLEHEELLSIAEPLLCDLPAVPQTMKPQSVYIGGEFHFHAETPNIDISIAFEVPGGWQAEKKVMHMTVLQPCGTEYGPYDYSRSANPTWDMLERLLAKLDKADRAFCFSTGTAALTVVTYLVGTGQEVVSGNDMYGGLDRLLSQVLPAKGVVVKRVNMTDLSEVASAVGPWTKLVWLETPANPRLQISDIRKIAEIAHAYGALVMVDNSIMSSVLSQPLELRADIVMHSATKFIYGHADVMAGVLAVKGERLLLENL